MITPGATSEERDAYRRLCQKLGIDAREDGWALWCTWDHRSRAHTMVTTALDTTRGLLDNWAQGRDVHPVQPNRAQITAVVRDWFQPVTLSPSHATTIGLGGC